MYSSTDAPAPCSVPAPVPAPEVLASVLLLEAAVADEYEAAAS
jgi:hypothetical protein